MSRGAGEKVFLFLWERLREVGRIAFSKAVPEDLNKKVRSKCNYDFSNRGYLHCAFLNHFIVSRKKDPTRKEICNFSFKIFKMKFSRF